LAFHDDLTFEWIQERVVGHRQFLFEYCTRGKTDIDQRDRQVRVRRSVNGSRCSAVHARLDARLATDRSLVA
jgi:hypothetical protein